MTEPRRIRTSEPVTPTLRRLTGRQEGRESLPRQNDRSEGVDRVGTHTEAHERMRDAAALMAEVGDEERAAQFRRFAYHALAEAR